MNNEVVIENCFVQYECPLKWDGLAKTNDKDDKIRFCDKCKENVYRVASTDELKKTKALGKKCVMFEIADLPNLVLTGNINQNQNRRVLMGNVI